MLISKRAALVLSLLSAFTGAVPPQIPFQAELGPTKDLQHIFASPSNSSFHDAYHRFEETNEFLRSLEQTHPENVVLDVVGYSVAGRPILAAAISHPEPNKDKTKLKKKPRFVLMGAQHAREWIATSTALYLSHALVTDEDEEWSMKKLLKHYDFFIIPTPNPDGYEYTWTTDRFWYKNTMPIQGSTCVGIDMNRNWPFGYIPSSSPKEGPCAAWYAGKEPLEAPEVSALATYFEDLKRVEAFIDLRSYGQMVSTPYSYTCDKLPPDAEDILEGAAGAAAALHLVHGTPMKIGRLCSTLYQAPGNILDWMYEQKGAKYSYAVHLRDTGTYGYLLPATWIKPVGEETTELVKYIVDFILEKKKEKGEKKSKKSKKSKTTQEVDEK